jgi:hypothetical protein
MTSKNFNALDRAPAPPAKAGTPNPQSPGFSPFLVPTAAIMRIAVFGLLPSNQQAATIMGI